MMHKLKVTEKDKAIAALAVALDRLHRAGFSWAEVESMVANAWAKECTGAMQPALPSPFCVGNPTKADCIRYGRCTRNPNCND